MVGPCAAPDCSESENPNPNISYFHFPNRGRFPKLYQLWLEALTQKYPDFKVTHKSTICELHFTEDDFDDTYKLKKVLMPGSYFRPVLKKDAVPKFNAELGEVGEKTEEKKEVLKELLGESYFECKKKSPELMEELKTEVDSDDKVKFENVTLTSCDIKPDIQDKVDAPPRIFSSTTDYILNKPLKPLPAALQKIIPSILSVVIKADNSRPSKFAQKLTPELFSCSANLEARNCRLCNFSTSLKIDLDKHYKIAHQPINVAGTLKRPPMKIHRYKEPKQYECVNCNFSTYSKLVLLKHVSATEEYHLLQETGTRWFNCEICPYKTTTNSNVKKHLWEKHNLKATNLSSFECEHCDFVTEKQRNLRKHLVRKHFYKKSNFYQCKNCFYQCVDADMLKKHQEDKHAMENHRFFCEICDYCSEYKQYMARHIQTKHSNQFLECESCNFKTTYKMAFESHMKKWHGK